MHFLLLLPTPTLLLIKKANTSFLPPVKIFSVWTISALPDLYARDGPGRLYTRIAETIQENLRAERTVLPS